MTTKGRTTKGRKAKKTSQYKGVYFKSNAVNLPWCVQHQGVWVGSYKTEQEAKAAYDAYIKLLQKLQKVGRLNSF